MVKLSNSIGATNIAQSTRLVTPLSNSLFEITHSEFADNESMMRFFPFTDLEYNSAEAAARDNIIASARVPVVAHISAPGASLDAIRAPPKLYGRSAINGIVGKDASKLARKSMVQSRSPTPLDQVIRSGKLPATTALVCASWPGGTAWARPAC